MGSLNSNPRMLFGWTFKLLHALIYVQGAWHSLGGNAPINAMSKRTVVFLFAISVRVGRTAEMLGLIYVIL